MLVVILIFARFFEVVAGFLLGPLKSFPNVKLFVVMVLTPFFMSVFFFWVMDNVLKQSDDESEGAVPAARVPAFTGDAFQTNLSSSSIGKTGRNANYEGIGMVNLSGVDE